MGIFKFGCAGSIRPGEEFDYDFCRWGWLILRRQVCREECRLGDYARVCALMMFGFLNFNEGSRRPGWGKVNINAVYVVIYRGFTASRALMFILTCRVPVLPIRTRTTECM